jgi:beta-ureidopropionase / N-carbamoyl-L-amino-acid hydrolase
MSHIFKRSLRLLPTSRSYLPTPKPSTSLQHVQTYANLAPIPSYKVNGTRLWDTIHATAKWGATPDGGIRRLALTDEDKSVREWFVSTTQSLGCTVKIDEMGNLFAIRPGVDASLPPIGIGSHLDTQPAGGKYDGILGVQAGIEILKVLQEHGHQTHAPLAVIDWTNEEGARFNTGMVSSGVWSGRYTLDFAHALTASEDKTGTTTIKSELERIGFLGETPATAAANPLSAHFELHIEQGPVLEDEQKKVGVVTGVQSMGWLIVTVHGETQHSGTCPMARRACALTSAARMISRVEDIALAAQGLSTVGVINSWPQSPATVPNKVVFSVDLSHTSTEVREEMIAETRVEFTRIAEAGKCSVEIEDIWNSPAVQFHEDCISCVREAARSAVGEENVKEMPAGAGHDSVHTSDKCPTSMVFIPSKDGISHHPAEYSSPDQWYVHILSPMVCDVLLTLCWQVLSGPRCCLIVFCDTMRS